jgi:carnosine N-methyltransferase
MKDVNKMENDFKSINQKYLNYLSFNYKDRINKIKQGIELNEKFLLSIVDKYSSNYKNKYNDLITRISEINKLRSTLKLFIRDWTTEGKKERDLTYIPIIEEIKENYGNNNKNTNIKILVPGGGLCRLAYDLGKLGFEIDVIEVSYYMIICSDYIFNSNLNINSYKIQPLIHSFNCLKDENSPFQTFNFPDENICEIMKSSNFGKINIIPGDFVQSFKDKKNAYECIVTSFFIDTANNIIEFIEIIYNLLKKDGIWINVGPLLYHFHEIQNEVSIELSWEELRKIILKFGFEIKNEKIIDSTYSSVEERLKTTIYSCIFFTAVKKDKNN